MYYMWNIYFQPSNGFFSQQLRFSSCSVFMHKNSASLFLSFDLKELRENSAGDISLNSDISPSKARIHWLTILCLWNLITSDTNIILVNTDTGNACKNTSEFILKCTSLKFLPELNLNHHFDLYIPREQALNQISEPRRYFKGSQTQEQHTATWNDILCWRHRHTNQHNQS